MAPNAKKMKLLVTGASGFIGYEVARQLSVNGYKPRLMIRNPGDDCEICHFDADFALADLRNHRSLEQAVHGVDGIIHLAAWATFESYQTLKHSILDGSLALMQAGVAAGVRCFVYSSSLLVYRGSRSMVDAHTPADPVLDFGRIKVEPGTPGAGTPGVDAWERAWGTRLGSDHSNTLKSAWGRTTVTH